MTADYLVSKQSPIRFFFLVRMSGVHFFLWVMVKSSLSYKPTNNWELNCKNFENCQYFGNGWSKWSQVIPSLCYVSNKHDSKIKEHLMWIFESFKRPQIEPLMPATFPNSLHSHRPIPCITLTYDVGNGRFRTGHSWNQEVYL